jgi:pimeloyl-ACP methyl ester carboxylesterase
MIQRRTLIAASLAWAAAPAAAQAAPAGLVLMHGKQGTPQFPGLRAVADRLEAAGIRTVLPEMPWSRTRYLDGPPEKAFAEIDAALAGLKRAGAAKLFVAGHSIGATAALGYAVSRADTPQRVDGIAMLATGHVPGAYYAGAGPQNAAIRAAVDQARAMRAAGDGAKRADFADNNQGQALRPVTTADAYLGYFEPGGAMDPYAQIAKAPCPVLWAVGRQDIIYPFSRTQYFDRLPADAQHAFFETDADHRGLPAAAADRTAAFFQALRA